MSIGKRQMFIEKWELILNKLHYFTSFLNVLIYNSSNSSSQWWFQPTVSLVIILIISNITIGIRNGSTVIVPAWRQQGGNNHKWLYEGCNFWRSSCINVYKSSALLWKIQNILKVLVLIWIVHAISTIPYIIWSDKT